MALLPYNPTTILSTNAKSDNIFYVFQQSTDDPPQSSLLALNVSDTFSTSPPTTVSTKHLPFAADNGSASYTPLMDSHGNIFVYAGQCAEGAEDAALWEFKPNAEDTNGTWHKQDVSMTGSLGSDGVGGPNFLAAGLMFASTVDGKSNLYIFGGMCPNSSTSDQKDWQQSGNYFDSMLEFRPAASDTNTSANFTASAISGHEPPIPEAGFTITALEPTFFNASNGDTTQQQSFVLIGGHTQTAFINMSQVALFSLPQQSWAFLPVDSPSTTGKTDLVIRTTDGIDPRSGHSAVLTPDGRQIIVLGGWVGNITTPASPQMAVLQLGEGYGGAGDWQWIIPSQNGVGLPTNQGLFGHGAAMLPGGVMMVTGGYSIPASGSSLIRRSAMLPNTATYLFNVTSGTWVPEYINPQVIDPNSAISDSGFHNSSTAEKIGLGAGLGAGLVLTMLILLVLFCYRRKVKRQKAAREREIRELALGAPIYHSSNLAMGGVDGRGGGPSVVNWTSGDERNSGDAYPWQSHTGNFAGQGDASTWKSIRAVDAERTGLLVEIPSPTRGLRRSLHSRVGYQPAPRYDDGRRNRGSGNIHRIDEREEYEGDNLEKSFEHGREMIQRPGVDQWRTSPQLDPFRDALGSHPPGASRTPSPESPAREREREVKRWVDDWTAADALMHQQTGRVSPEKTDRTSSTLSDLSMHSTVSALSFQQSIGTIGRSISQRSGAFFTSTPFSSGRNAVSPSHQTFEAPAGGSSAHNVSNNRRSKSLTLNTARRRPNTADTYFTASTSFAQLQAEGETLLGGRHVHDGTSPRRSYSRQRGWMGSMRRAFTGGSRSASSSPDRGERSTSSSPIKLHHPDTGLPKRAASAGAMLWRKRQGARDWDVEGNADKADGHAGPVNDGQEEDEEEWDVESAVERRVVQVMFTVPKEKLRVVNAGPDGDGASILSLERQPSHDNMHPDNKGKQAESVDRARVLR
ncbi:hypothetical protein MMC13_001772 [Lambiella insularis]|nr:hypothetical protein [Lambiella insularis]